MNKQTVPAELGSEIKELSDESGPLKILVYGAPGTGKTRFSFSGMPNYPTLILSAEAGLLSLKKVQRELGVKAKFWEITDLDSLSRARDYLYNMKHEYQVVAIDSLTEIQAICMAAILKKEGRERPEIRDWGTLNDKMVAIIRSFRDLPNISVIATALDEQIKDESTGEVKTVPLFQGRIQKTVAGYFDQVMYSFVAEKTDAEGKVTQHHRLLTRNNGKITGKDRSGMLPILVEPDFIKIHDLIYKRGESK